MLTCLSVKNEFPPRYESYKCFCLHAAAWSSRCCQQKVGRPAKHTIVWSGGKTSHRAVINMTFSGQFSKKNVITVVKYIRIKHIEIGCIPIFRQPNIPTAQYSDSPMFRQPNIPTAQYSDSPIFRQPNVSTAQYSDSPIFRQPNIPTAQCFDSPIFRQPNVSTAQYSGSPIFRQPNNLTRASNAKPNANLTKP